MTDEPTSDPVVKVARDLREIGNLAAGLEDQAIHKANSPDHMPGGAAMVALAGVANVEAWEHRYEAAEAWNADPEHKTKRPVDHVADEDDAWEPPLQTLCFWSEAWRVEHGKVSDLRPTIGSEAAFLRGLLDWAWDNEPHFEDFAADMRKARRRLEDVLYAGERVERGAPCMYPECKGTRLTRRIDDKGHRSPWWCRRCHREWDEDRYAQMVTAAHEASKFEDIDGVTWCSLDYAARLTGRSIKTLRTWVNRGELATVCIVAGRRRPFVRRDEVQERHARAKKPRGRAA